MESSSLWKKRLCPSIHLNLNCVEKHYEAAKIIIIIIIEKLLIKVLVETWLKDS